MKIFIQILICCTIFGQLHAQQKTSGKHLSGRENSTWQFFEESERVPASELAKNKTLLKLGAKDELKPVSDKADKTGMRHYRYQQTHNGVPVESAVYLMHEKNTRVTYANGSLVYGLSITTTASISEEAALQTALQYTDATLYAWEDEAHEQALKYTKRNLSATFCPSGELVIIDPQFTQQAANCRLAYKFDIYAVQPLSRQVVYVDAHSGEVLKVIEKIHSCTDTPSTGDTNYSGAVDITACSANGEYTLKNNIGGGMQVLNAEGDISLSETPFHDPDGHFDMDATAVDVHWATEKTYNYLLETFDRNSIDGSDAQLLSWVHFGNQLNNAYWNGAWMLYGDGDGTNFSSFTSPDMVAHEIIHGLTDYTSNLIYEGESGALNESFSDIFGEVIERYSRGTNDWIIGADFTLAPKNGLRNLANPNDPTMITLQPDTYLGDYYQSTGFADYGGVHTNSGIQNHWFYLLSEGGTGTNDNSHTYDITGIGMAKAAAIAYLNLTTLAPNANFEDARLGAIQTAEQLYGEDSNEAIQTEAAWCAVGVGSECVIPDCRTIDSLALVALYNATNGANWTNTWDLNEPLDDWYGVTLDGNGCVIKLSLPNNQLNGNIPSEIGDLSNLIELNLFDNQLMGSIPSELGNLNNLTKLWLHHNQLNGNIPPELGNLNNLTLLHLHHNELSGSIPSEIGNLSSLIELSLKNNQLTAIPPEIGNLGNLTGLYLSFNQLTSIPAELGNLSSLTKLHIYDNEQLTGSIPPEIGNLSNLIELWLFNNELTGNIPPELGNLNSLIGLQLYNNQLSGSIPPEIGNLSNLTGLNLSYNELTGNIPSEIGNLSSLTYLSLKINQLSGSILPEIGNLNDLTELYLNGNQLDGCYSENLAGLCVQLSSASSFISGGNNFDASWEDFCSTGAGACSPCRYTDSLALVALYDSTNGAGWTNTWDLNQPMDIWWGVTLHQNDCVRFLHLEANQLVGSIPPELGNLSNLTAAWLGDNEFSGSIPATLGNLSNLTALDLGTNELTGSIPPELGNLSNLTFLSLGSNQLVGNIPPELGSLSNLERLFLPDNQLIGNIPPELGSLSNLERLFLSDNRLVGNIPPQLVNLNNLQWLFLNNNELSGNIPPRLGNLSNLTHLNLGFNELTGNIPPELGNLSNLTYLGLELNQLNGSIPPEIGNLSNLSNLYLYDSQLSGCYDANLSNLCNQLTQSGITFNNNFDAPWEDFCNTGAGTCGPCRQSDSLALVALYDSTNGVGWINTWDLNQPMDTWYGVTLNGDGCVSCLDMDGEPDCNSGGDTGNNLIGNIPSEIGNLTHLAYLNLSYNQLTGAIPPEIGNLSNLKWLRLYNNQLSGSIPSEIGNLSNLIDLFLHENQLSGSIPPEIGNLSNLKRLLLHVNQLSGSIPPEIGNLSDLNILRLDSNKLIGSIPPEIGNLTDLTILYLYNNQLNGIIPPEMGNLINLTLLSLHTNQLSGSIPPEIGNLSNLTTLYLSYNELDGSIPPEIGNLINLTVLSLSSNELNGSIPPEIGNLINLTYLSLQTNQLSGNIPPEIGNLIQLVTLRLKENSLINIPPELGNLSNLAELSLIDNQLTGSIPSELGNLGNLTLLSLYNNQLTGSIPPELGNLSNLINLYLYNNQLTGNIPPELGNLSNLTGLLLFDNQFSGNIPPQLGDLDSLLYLRLYNNQLDGCYDANLLNLCSQLADGNNGNISMGNNFYATWEDFCTNGTGTCPPNHVLPGDFNNDGIVNKDDLIYWGLAKEYTGPVRPNATTAPIPQDSPEWGASISGVNCKHQDANGDGIIDEADLNVFISNYGSGDSPYSHDASPASYTLQQVSISDPIDGLRYITYDLYLQANNATINTHGISVSVEFKDRPYIDTIEVDIAGSMLQPTHYMTRYETDGSNHIIEIALTRTDKTNQLIDGPVARLIVADRDVKLGIPTDIEANIGKMMSATGVVTSVGGSVLYGSLPGGVPSLPISLAINHPYCQTSGTAEVVVAEGTPPYTYTWSTGATSSKINDLGIGTYNVRVSDAAGLSNMVYFDVEWAFAPVEVSSGNGQICFDFEDAPLTEAVEVSLDDELTYMPPITEDTCYAVTAGEYPIWIRLASGDCATFLGEQYDTCTTTLNIIHIDDNDVDIGINDTENFEDNPVCIYPYDDPGLPLDAILTNLKLELYFKLFGTSCEQDIELRITDPVGGVSIHQPFTTCDGPGDLYHVFLDVPDVSFTGSLSDWQVEFRDTNDNNSGLTEYSVRFSRLTYDATFNECDAEEVSTFNKNETLSQLSEIRLYPVPVKGILNMEYTSDQEGNLLVETFDVRGKILTNKKEHVLSGVNILKMDIHELPQGVYYMRISDAFGRNQIKSFAKVSP